MTYLEILPFQTNEFDILYVMKLYNAFYIYRYIAIHPPPPAPLPSVEFKKIKYRWHLLTAFILFTVPIILLH